jgi:hypothetical protein
MRRLVFVACVFSGLVAGCEEKAPTQAGPKAVTIHTTDGARTTTP